MGLSVNTFTYAGSDVFNLNFALGYASRQDVTCFTVAEPSVELDFDWLTDNQVRLVAGHGLANGDELDFKRTVSKTALPVDLTKPGAATRENITLVYEHVLYALHEVLDERASDVSPWDIVGNSETLLNAVTEIDYLSIYREAKDDV